jgi:hypothetical protein
MRKGLVTFGLFLILMMVFIKYFFVPMLVDYLRTQASQYIGSTISSYLITLDNIERFCNAINSKVGIFGITIQDIAKFISPDTVNKCNQFLILMQILTFEYVFYIAGLIFIVAGLVLGGKKEVHIIREVERPKHEEEPEETEEEEEKPKKGKKFCSECGNPVGSKDKFCEKCGNKL